MITSFRKWRYRRLTKKKGDLIEMLRIYLQFSVNTPFETRTYKDRVTYSVYMRSRNMGILLTNLQVVLSTIRSRNTPVKEYAGINTQRNEIRLDRFLTDDAGVRIDEPTSVRNLQDVLNKLITELDAIKTNEPYLYPWYVSEFRFIYLDSLAAIDALLALTLGVSDVQRHWKAAAIRRQRTQSS